MLHSFHLAEVPARVTAQAMARRPGRRHHVAGLQHAEPMGSMRLGAPVVSPDRMQLRRLAMFCAWQDEAALDAFLADDPLGQQLAGGWHVRLQFLRRWGHVTELAGLPEVAGRSDPDEPMVAFTLARMKIPEVPRFLHWGRPVERLVRDHPDVTLALAAARPPRTVATFTIWRTTRAMTDMVFGRSAVDGPRRHADAMVERERRDFHHEFTTLRFRPVGEHGSWQGRTGIVPV